MSRRFGEDAETPLRSSKRLKRSPADDDHEEGATERVLADVVMLQEHTAVTVTARKQAFSSSAASDEENTLSSNSKTGTGVQRSCRKSKKSLDDLQGRRNKKKTLIITKTGKGKMREVGQDSSLLELPLEMLVAILLYLTPTEVTRVISTCRKFSLAGRIYFASLKTLHLSHFHTNAHLPDIIRHCPLLEHVNAYHSSVDHHGFQILSQGLPRLRDLRISEKHQNSKETFKVPEVARLVRKMFIIASSDVTETDRVTIEDLPLFTNASDLSLYRFGVRAPLHFGTAPSNLRLLMCSFRLPAGEAPFREQDLMNLKKLNFHSCKEFQGHWFNLFATCTRLEDLNIHNTAVADGFFERAHFPHLKTAHFGTGIQAGPEAISEFVRRHIPELTSLSLARVDTSLLDLIGHFETQLTYVSLEGAEDLPLTKTRLSAFLLRCVRLNRLELSGMRGIPGLLCGHRFFQQLEVLELSKLPDFDASHVEKIISKTPRLKFLALHFPTSNLFTPIKITSQTLVSVSLRIQHVSSLILGDCPKLNSLLGKFPESLETSGDIRELHITGSCPNLRILVVPTKFHRPGRSLWHPVIEAVRLGSMTNLLGFDCNYHPTIPELVRTLRVPYVLCYNCTDISFSFFETFCSLSEQTGARLSDFMNPMNELGGGRAGGDELLRREKVACFRTPHDGHWRREWFATNIKSFAELLKREERRSSQLNDVVENYEIHDYLRNGFKKKRFFLVSMLGRNMERSPF